MTIEPGPNGYLLFDGDCGICSWSADRTRAIDRRHRWVIVPYQSFDESELKRFGLDLRLCSTKVRLIAPSGRVYGGAFAVNRFLLDYFPWSVISILMYLLPPILLMEIAIYALIARNRHHISRWLGMNACRIR